jgi:hypothetical protein
LTSVYKPELEYRVGVGMREQVQPDHGGGFYFFQANSGLTFWQQYLTGRLVTIQPGDYAMVSVKAGGPYLAYDYEGNCLGAPRNGLAAKKLAASYIEVTAVHKLFKIAVNPIGYDWQSVATDHGTMWISPPGWFQGLPLDYFARNNGL